MRFSLRIFSFVVIFTNLLLISSCSDEFLMKEPIGVGAGSVMTTPDGIESILTGTYAALKGRYMFGGALGTDWVYGSVTSDDSYKGTSAGDSSPMGPLESYYCIAICSYFVQRWTDCYEGVARANSVLEFLAMAQEGKTPLSATRAIQVEAEAKFLRAWFHFQANKVFEHIPYIKTIKELAPLLPEEVPNPDPAWAEIEEDLQFAIDNLPENFPGEPGRADRYAAMAVKAHAHMYQKEFDQARILLDGIINNGGFTLAPNFYDNYDMTHENNSESIFELQAATTPTAHTSMMISGAVFHQKGPASCGGWGFFQPSQCLFEAFQVTPDGLPVLEIDEREPLANDMGVSSSTQFIPTDHLLDPRVDWTIARRGVDFLGWGIHPGYAWIREQPNGGPYMTKKYMHFKSEQSLNLYMKGFYNGKNYRMYRLTNILLWRAEAAVEDNDLELARDLVNSVRIRAKNSTPVMGLCLSYSNLGSDPVVDWTKPAANYKIEPYPSDHPAFSSQTEARKAVRMEIRLEFATEGHRFFDLRRWDIDDEVLNDFIARDLTFRPTMRWAIYDPVKNDYWPLPQSQVDMQKKVLQQDPSYVK
ncbi:MAG: RagB/SusD family nutrient uptake outer membrane protein [Bacteroidales bacterium]